MGYSTMKSGRLFVFAAAKAAKSVVPAAPAKPLTFNRQRQHFCHGSEAS
jgi:hypothetical protein